MKDLVKPLVDGFVEGAYWLVCWLVFAAVTVAYVGTVLAYLVFCVVAYAVCVLDDWFRGRKTT